jgi:hypothetical protein
MGAGWPNHELDSAKYPVEQSLILVAAACDLPTGHRYEAHTGTAGEASIPSSQFFIKRAVDIHNMARIQNSSTVAVAPRGTRPETVGQCIIAGSKFVVQADSMTCIAYVMTQLNQYQEGSSDRSPQMGGSNALKSADGRIASLARSYEIDELQLSCSMRRPRAIIPIRPCAGSCIFWCCSIVRCGPVSVFGRTRLAGSEDGGRILFSGFQ